MYGSWDMVRDGRTDGQEKWHIELGIPPKNKTFATKTLK